jgi:hypoxanthine phosphoribosyltransferase
MDEMINAGTSLFPLLTISQSNGFYYNTSILLFSIISSLNHILPENLNGLTHGVKLLFSNILFAMLGINPLIGICLSLSDLTPLFTENKKIKKIGELFMQIPRQLIEMYLIYGISDEYYTDCTIMIICKIIYFFERRARIKNGTRNDFSFLHSAEHLGLYLLFKDITKSELNLNLLLSLQISLICFVALVLIFFNHYMEANMHKRIPNWAKDDSNLRTILQNKIAKNKNSYKWHNYIVKPWLSHLKLEFVSWRSIESICDSVLKNINPDDFDMVVGIVTGGSFVGGYIAQKLNKPLVVIHSKLWSDNSFKETVYKSSTYFMGYDLKPTIGDVPDVKNKRILLADDTTYTGMTFTKVVQILSEKGNAKSIKTFCMWVRGDYNPHYFYSNKRVPIIWEWGSEVD